MIDPTVKSIIRTCVDEMRAYEPKWDEEDIFLSACGAVLKHAEKSGQDATINPTLLATIQTVVRHEMSEQ